MRNWICDEREYKEGDHACACNLFHRYELSRPVVRTFSPLVYFIVILISCGRSQGHSFARSLVRQSTKTENEGRELDTQGRAAAEREREREPRKEDTRNTENSLLDPIRHRKRRRRRRRRRSGSSQDGNGGSVRSPFTAENVRHNVSQSGASQDRSRWRRKIGSLS